MKKKAITQLTAFTAVFLCFALVFGSTSVFAANNSNPDAIDNKTSVIFPFVFFRSQPDLAFSSIKKIFFYGKKVKVLGYSGNFTYVEDISGKEKGYIFRMFIEDDEEGELKTAKSVYCVYEGKKRTSHIKIDYNGSKNISWELSKPGIVEVTKESDGNLSIKGLSPGSVTLTIKAGLLGRKECTLFCIYEWKKPWTGKAKKDTYVRKGAGDNYDYWKKISSGDKFIVSGDDGSSDGWAYGNVSGTDTWGFVKINDISTKGTVSQYNNMKTSLKNGEKVLWYWPVLNEIDGVSQSKNANYISSPYAPRSDSTSKTIHHRGMDITTGTSGDIKKYSVVSAVSGTVKAIRSNIDSCGFCVSISSDCLDPITGQKIAVIYMHLYEAPKYSNGKIVQVGDEISVGTIIGKVGKSNGNTNSNMGYHLHFETNNRNAAVGDSGRSDFTNTINPIYYYLNKSIRINNGSEACENGYTAYWYNKNQ